MFHPSVIFKLLRPIATHGTCGDEKAAKLIDVGTEKYLEFFKEEIFRDLVSKGGSSVRIIEGAYGFGKSHFLKLMSLFAYSEGFFVIYTELNTVVKFENWKIVVEEILRNLYIMDKEKKISSLPKVLEYLGTNNKVNLDELDSANVSHPSFKKAMSYMAGPQKLDKIQVVLLSNYLRGNRVRVADLKRAGLPGVKNPLSKKNCEQVLETALTSIHALTGKGVLLMFDETENTFGGRSPKKIRGAANLMRRFIDSCITGNIRGTIAIFAVLNDFVEACGQAYDALGQRLNSGNLQGENSAWRSPVLSLEKINSLSKREEFMEASIERAMEILRDLDLHSNHAETSIRCAAITAVEAEAGSGYRRALWKAIAVEILKLKR